MSQRDIPSICGTCGKAFLAYWKKPSKTGKRFCGRACTYEFTRGKYLGGGAPKGFTPWITGKKHTLKARIKIRRARKKQIVPRFWYGDKKEYDRIHRIIRREYIKGTKCEQCGIDKLTGRFIHWANLSGRYTLDRNDWRVLCAKCHKRYDYDEFNKEK